MKTVTEKEVRERFKNIIGGKGFVIPRAAVKIAVDDLFKEEVRSMVPAEECSSCLHGPKNNGVGYFPHDPCIYCMSFDKWEEFIKE